MKYKRLKQCFFCIKDKDAPFLKDIKEELSSAGITAVVIDEETVTLPGDPTVSYIITDNMDGVRLARTFDTGYVFLICEDLKRIPDNVPDAECLFSGFDELTSDFIEKMYERKHGIPWTIAVTERTIIRELSLDDIDDLFDLYEDTEIKKYIPPLLSTKEEEREFQRAYIEKMYGFFGFGFWNILDRKDGRLIGRAGISMREGFDIPELGYLLCADKREKGIAFEVCSAVLTYAKEILGLEKLLAFIQPENLPSVRLIKKLGFTDSGEKKEVGGQEFSIYSLYL